MKIVFTLCSNNYLAQAKTLGDSVKEHHPECEFVIGLIDKKASDIDYEFFRPHSIVAYDDIGYTCFEEMIERYNIVEFNTAVKPFYFEYLSKTIDAGGSIYYIDPDILLHQPMKEVEDKLQTFDFILTPHLLYPADTQGKFEKLILNVGVFNLGFLALRITKQTRNFLRWWQDRLLYDCRISYSEGLFVDQIWANFIPCLFNKVYILKHPGYNMGYWNFNERTISESEGYKVVNKKFHLVLFHYSSYNPMKPEILCRWLNYSFDQRPDLKDVYDSYSKLLLSNGYETFHAYPRGLQFKLNHPHADSNDDKKKIQHQAEKKLGSNASIRKRIGYAIKNRLSNLIKILFK